MEMLAALASIKRLFFFFFEHVTGTIWKLHHNHPSKSYSFVFQAAFISPQSGKAKSQYVDSYCTA